jgi:hypothetical protein
VTFKPSHTAWNGDQLDYDALILNPNDARECSYCLTQPQAKALIALIDRYRFATRWFSEDEPIDRLDLEHFVNDCQRRLMMSCCGDEIPRQFRFNDSGDLESSDDGGATWNTDPGRDPRESSPIFPPPGGEMNDKCVSADAGVNAVKNDVYAMLVAEMTRDDLENLIKVWITRYIETSNPVLALIEVAVNLIMGAGIDVIIAALTTEQWDILRCCFFNHMNDDLSFDHDGWVGLRTCVQEDMSLVAGTFIEHLLYLIGTRGCTNIIRSGLGSVSADCAACVPPNCVTIWDHIVEGSGIVTHHEADGYFDAEAEFLDGQWQIALQTGDGTDNMLCCDLSSRSFVTEEVAALFYWRECGSDTTFGPGVPGFGCVHTIFVYSASPFTMRFNPVDCS